MGEDKGGGFYYSPPIKGGEITSPLAPLSLSLWERVGVRGGEGELMQKFEEAMNDDFNAAQAIGYLNTELHHLNSIRSKSSEFLKGVANIRKIGDVLGFFGQNPYEYFEREKSEGLASIGISEDEIKRLISEREMARKEKKWKDGDRIRDELSQKGIILEDSPQGTVWKVRSKQ